MKNHKLIVSKNTYFNFKAGLRSFRADSGLSPTAFSCSRSGEEAVLPPLSWENSL